MALSFTRKVNMSPGQRDTGDVIDAGDVNELQEALEDISLGTVPIPLAGIEGALGAYEPLNNMRAGRICALDLDGVVADGVTDCGDPIRDAISAGYALDLGAGVLGFTGEISIPYTVSLDGRGIEYTTLKALDSTARIVADQPSWGSVGGFTFDGNGVATVGIEARISHKSHWHDILVTDVAGTAFRLYDVQNGNLTNIETRDSQRGFHIDGGCGSLVIDALASHDNVEWQLKIGSSGTPTAGYNQPTSITFINPMLEWISAQPTSEAVAVCVLEGGDHVLFVNPNFSGAQGASSSFHTIRASVVSPATVCKFTLLNAQINNGFGDPVDAAIALSGSANLQLMGRNQIIGADVGVLVSGTAARIWGDKPTMLSVSTPYSFTDGAAGYINTTGETDEYPVWIVPVDAVLGRALMVGRPGEAGLRLQINRDGQMVWGDGTDYTGDTILYRGGANLLKTGDAFELPGTYQLPLRLGNTCLWVNASSGKLYKKNGAPSTDTDGTIVGTES